MTNLSRYAHIWCGQISLKMDYDIYVVIWNLVPGTPLNKDKLTVPRSLLEAKTVLESLLETSSRGVCALSPDLTIIFWNLGMEEITGLKREQVLGVNAAEFFPKIKQPDRYQLFQDILSGKEVSLTEQEYSIIGSNHHGHCTIVRTALRDEAGKIIGVLGIIEDITELHSIRQYEKALIDAGERLSATLNKEELIQIFPQVFVPKVADWCAVFTKSSQKPFLIEVSHTDPSIALRLMTALQIERLSFDLFQSYFGKAFLTPTFIPETSDAQWIQICSDEYVRTTLVSSNCRSLISIPLMSANASVPIGGLLIGKIDKFSNENFALAQVIGHRMAIALENADMYESAKEQIKVREDLMAIVSHDLRSPLATIQMTENLIGEACDRLDPSTGGVLKNYMEIIDRSVRQAQELVNTILDASAIQQTGLKVDIRPTSLHELIENVIQSFSIKVQSKSILLSSIYEAGAPALIPMDIARMTQVLSNIIGNALKFTPPKGKIEVRIKASNDHVRISVEDTGPGISENNLKFMFEKNWQVASSNSGAAGIGLGLYIAKKIVESHSGRIWAESILGQGTSVMIELPKSKA